MHQLTIADVGHGHDGLWTVMCDAPTAWSPTAPRSLIDWRGESTRCGYPQEQRAMWL